MRNALLLIALVVSACGSTEGSPCSTANAQECSGGKTLLVCEGGKWASYPCPSCAGNKCDWKGAMSGDACPKVAETYGTCNLDGRIISCFFSASAGAGVFVESSCPACMAGKSIEELGKCSSGRCSCQ